MKLHLVFAVASFVTALLYVAAWIAEGRPVSAVCAVIWFATGGLWILSWRLSRRGGWS